MNSSDEPKIAIINSSFDSIFEGSETSSYLQVNGKKIRNCMECMFNENYVTTPRPAPSNRCEAARRNDPRSSSAGLLLNDISAKQEIKKFIYPRTILSSISPREQECYQDSFEVLKQTNRQLKHEIRTQKEQLKCAIQKINEICHKYNFEEYLVNDEFDITDIKFS